MRSRLLTTVALALASVAQPARQDARFAQAMDLLGRVQPAAQEEPGHQGADLSDYQAKVLGGDSGHGSTASPRSQEPTTQGQDPAAARTATLDLLARLIPAIEAELARDGADSTDVRALARRLGSPQAALQFVRDHIAFEPYEGVLRGPAGALAARAANSWDQALLLQALLTAMGKASRIVQCQLGDAQCDALVDAFLLGAPRPEPAIDEAKALGDAARATGIAAAQLHDLLAGQQATAQASFAEMQQLATVHTRLLRAALGDHAVDGAAMRAAAVAGVRQHAFVQLAESVDGEGRYRDLDATPLGSADGHSGVKGVVPVAVMPRHTVRFQLLYKTTAAETTILDFTTDVADALRQPLGFQVAPADPDLPSLAQVLQSTPQDVRARWQKIKLWQATLRTGTTEHPSRVFDLAGGLHDVAGDGRIRGASELGAGVAGGFGALGGAVEKPKSTFQQLSLVTTLRAPGGQDRVFTRVLLDAAGRDRGDTPNVMWRILALGGPIGAEVVARAGLATDLVLWRGLRSVLQGDAATAVAALQETGLAIESAAPVELMRLELQRERQSAALAQRQGVRRWMPVAQLLVFERRMPMCDSDADCATLRLDWMANDVRFLAADAGRASAAFDAALEQGVADTVIEAMALEYALPLADVRSAAHCLERLRDAGRTLEKRSPVGDRLAFAVAGESCWYEVDAAFGCAVGRLRGGQGGAEAVLLPQSMTEYLKANRPAIWFLLCVSVVIKKTEWMKGTGENMAGGLAKLAGCFLGAHLRFLAVYPASPFVGSQVLGLLGDLLSGGISFFG